MFEYVIDSLRTIDKDVNALLRNNRRQKILNIGILCFSIKTAMVLNKLQKENRDITNEEPERVTTCDD